MLYLAATELSSAPSSNFSGWEFVELRWNGGEAMFRTNVNQSRLLQRKALINCLHYRERHLPKGRFAGQMVLPLTFYILLPSGFLPTLQMTINEQKEYRDLSKRAWFVIERKCAAPYYCWESCTGLNVGWMALNQIVAPQYRRMRG